MNSATNNGFAADRFQRRLKPVVSRKIELNSP